MEKTTSTLTKEEKEFAILKFVKPEKINWAREIKILNALSMKYPKEIWVFMVLGYSLNSMAFFNTENGIKEINASLERLTRSKTKKTVVNFDNPEYTRTTSRTLSFKERLLNENTSIL